MLLTSAEQLLHELDAQRGAMLEMLASMARRESPSTQPETVAAWFDACADGLAARGWRARRHGDGDGPGVLWTTWQRSRPRPFQLLLGHADTVWPTGTLATMPVEAVRDPRGEEVVRGPGTFDMKAGLVQGVFAVETAARLHGDLPVTPVLMINADEEIGSRGSTRHIARAARGADRVFVLEPALGPTGKLKTARKGVGRFTVEVEGRAAHAGLDPEAGASAILELAHVIQQLFALNDPAGGVTLNVGTIDGGGRANVVAARSRAVVDVRVRDADAAARITAAIHGLQPSTEGTALRVEGAIRRPPMVPDADSRALWRAAKRAAGALGFDLEETTAGGGSDGNTTIAFAPTLDGLGAVGDGAHAPDEHILVDKMVERAALLGLLLTQPVLRRRRP